MVRQEFDLLNLLPECMLFQDKCTQPSSENGWTKGSTLRGNKVAADAERPEKASKVVELLHTISFRCGSSAATMTKIGVNVSQTYKSLCYMHNKAAASSILTVSRIEFVKSMFSPALRHSRFQVSLHKAVACLILIGFWLWLARVLRHKVNHLSETIRLFFHATAGQKLSGTPKSRITEEWDAVRKLLRFQERSDACHGIIAVEP